MAENTGIIFEEELENLHVQIELAEEVLSDRQKKFVEEYISNGGNASAAAWDAGYKVIGNNRENARFVGYQVRRSPRVKRLIGLKLKLKSLMEMRHE